MMMNIMIHLKMWTSRRLRFEMQGKRKEQIRASYVALGLSLMGVLLTILGFFLYHIRKFLDILYKWLGVV